MNALGVQALPFALDEAARLARALDVPLDKIAVHRFPDGEMRVTVGTASRTAVIYAALNQPNDKLLAVLFAAEALRRGGAERLVLVAPYLCYTRQDAAFQRGEAISQRVVGKLFAAAVDRIVTVDAHLHRTANIRDMFPGIEADNLSAIPAIAAALAAAPFDRNTVIVGPDAESRPWVTGLAERLGAAFAVARKTRRDDRLVEIEFDDRRLFAGRPVLLIDDIVSSGGTLLACAKALTAAGAAAVDAVAIHALFPADLTVELAQAGIRSLRSTDSVPHPTNAIRLDGVLAAALRKETVHNGGGES